MEKIDKNLIDQFNRCTVDEICGFIIMELQEVQGEFQEFQKFFNRHKRAPARLSRTIRVKTIGIEKLISLFRKKTVIAHKEVVEVKKTRQQLKQKEREMRIQENTRTVNLEVKQYKPLQFSKLFGQTPSSTDKSVEKLISSAR